MCEKWAHKRYLKFHRQDTGLVGLPWWLRIHGFQCTGFSLHLGVALLVKNPPANAGDVGTAGSIPASGRPRRSPWQPIPVFLPGKCMPWTDEPGGLQSMGSQSRKGLKRLSTRARVFFHNILKKSLHQLFDQPNINKAPYLIQIFKGFHLMSFLYPGIPPGHHITVILSPQP